MEVSAKNKLNRTVYSMGTVQIVAGSGDISKNISGNGQPGNVPMEVVGDTGGTHSQAAQGKVT